MLTKSQRAALAREARNLASECAEGTAKLEAWPNCAVGVAWRRAFGWGPDYWSTILSSIPLDIGALSDRNSFETVANANDKDDDQRDRSLRVVFPLLALADELEGR